MDFIEVLATAAAELTAELITQYDIKIGLNQFALIYRPTDEFVEIYTKHSPEATGDYRDNIPLAEIFTAIVKHNLKVNPPVEPSNN